MYPEDKVVSRRIVIGLGLGGEESYAKGIGTFDSD